LQLSATVSSIRQVIRRANELLRGIAEVRRQRLVQEASLNEEVQKLKDVYGPTIDALTTLEEKHVAELVGLVLPRFYKLARKGTKTIFLRSGQIKLRSASEDKVVIADGVSEDTIIKRIARKRGIRKFTRIGKRTLNRDALKQHPEFVAQIEDLSLRRTTTLTIMPARTQGSEIKLDADNLSIPLPQED
jgi:phage host-nuclease inhibitor protein Gam